jgi:hypothetical protein
MSVIVPATLSEFKDLVSEDIQNIFVKRGTLKTPNIDKYFNVTDVQSYYTKDSSVSGTKKAKYVSENASVVYDAPVQGFNKTYTQKKYADGLKISDQLWKFGIEFRKITTLVESLMDSMIEKVEDDGAEMLNNGFSTSFTDENGLTVSTAGGDSVAYFSSAHTREDGGPAWNNIIYDGTTYNMDFEYDALKALRYTAAAVLGPRGQTTDFTPDTLVCKYGSSVHSRYEEIQGAIARNMIPGGDENDAAAKVGLPKLITLRHLDNDGYYFAFDSRYKNDVYGLQWKWAQRPKLLEPETEYDTQLYKQQAIMFYDRGANDMRNWYGSKGTNSL